MVTVPSSSKCVYILLIGEPLPEGPEEPRRMPLAEVFEGGGALTVTLAEAAAAESERVVERGGDGGGRRVTLGGAAGV